MKAKIEISRGFVMSWYTLIRCDKCGYEMKWRREFQPFNCPKHMGTCGGMMQWVEDITEPEGE